MHAFRRWAVLVSCLIVGADPESRGAVILDTGDGGVLGAGTALFTNPPDRSGFARLAGKFTVDHTFTITSAEGLIGNFAREPGEVSITLARDASGIPGEFLFTGAFAVPVTYPISEVPHWLGVTDVNWKLTPGSYWVVFAAGEGTIGTYMPWGAPNPMEGYAAWDPSNTETWALDDGLNLGVRLSGNLSPVPEPATFGLFGALGLSALVIARRRRAG